MTTHSTNRPDEGYMQKKFDGPTKRFCQTLDLKDDPDLIADYCRLHEQGYVWQEILEASVVWASLKWKSTCSARASL